MIIIHEGVPGSGKSYDAIRKIIDAIKAGRQVYTNIDGLDRLKCREYLSNLVGTTRFDLDTRLHHMTADQVKTFWDVCPDGSFVVIDEAQLYFNSRDFAKDNNRQFSDWASTHRHKGFDLLLITQRAARIDTAVRSLCEFRYRYRKLNVFGSLIKKGYLVYTFCGEDTEHMSIQKRSYDPKIFPAYNSYEGDNTEKAVQKNPNLLNHPIFYLLAICVAASIYLLPQSQLFSGDLKAVVTGKSKEQRAAAAPGQLAPGQPGAKPLPVVGSLPIAATDSLAPAIAGQVQAVAAIESVFEWIPVTAFMRVGQKEYVMIGRYRLPSYVRISDDYSMVLVDKTVLPAPVINFLRNGYQVPPREGV